MNVFKTIVVVLLLVIIASMAKAMVHMVRGDHGGEKMVRALSWRVGLSIGLLLLIVIGAELGYIEPHDIYRRGP